MLYTARITNEVALDAFDHVLFDLNIHASIKDVCDASFDVIFLTADECARIFTTLHEIYSDFHKYVNFIPVKPNG